jgi:hypothetical protein
MAVLCGTNGEVCYSKYAWLCYQFQYKFFVPETGWRVPNLVFINKKYFYVQTIRLRIYKGRELLGTVVIQLYMSSFKDIVVMDCCLQVRLNVPVDLTV